MHTHTEITVEILGLKVELMVPGYLVASAFEIPEGGFKSFKDEHALRILIALPNVGAGHRQMFEALIDAARDAKQAGPWLEVMVEHIK